MTDLVPTLDAGMRLKRAIDRQVEAMIRAGLVPGLLIVAAGWFVRADPQRTRTYALFWMIAVAIACLIWMTADMVRLARTDPAGLHEDARLAIIGKKLFWIPEIKEWHLPYVLLAMFCIGCVMVGVYFWGTWGNPKTPRLVNVFGLFGSLVFTGLSWTALMVGEIGLPIYLVKLIVVLFYRPTPRNAPTV